MTELPSGPAFKEIKPETISSDDAHSFWDDLFSVEDGAYAKELSDLSLQDEMFNWAEEDLVFDVDTQNTELRDIMSAFHSDAWRELPDAQKLDAIQDFADYLNRILGIENRPRIRYFEDEETNCGFFDPNTNTISINRNTLHDPKEIVDTVAHETRHAFQHQRAAIGETDTDKLIAYNLANYIAPEFVDRACINYFDYLDQYVEVDARAFAALFTN